MLRYYLNYSLFQKKSESEQATEEVAGLLQDSTEKI
jgi:hypothetical protein